VMNSRRRMCSSRAEDRTLPHRWKKSPVLHRSKLDRRSSAPVNNGGYQCRRI